MGFGQGLSGLNAAAQNLDIIGNNIANSGTVGYKSASATFADIYASTRTGLGVQVASVNQRFTIGTITGTGNQFDMAIDGAKGMFRVQDASGNVLYTRNGQFFADKENYIVNAQGQRLTGYAAGGTQLAPVRVPVGNMAPSPTSTVSARTNFDANAPVISQDGRAEQSGMVALMDGAAPAGTYYYRVSQAGVITWYDAAGVQDDTLRPAAGTYQSAGKDVVIDASGQLESGEFSTSAPDTPYLEPLGATPFDPANPDSYTHSLRIAVYDSLGNPHDLDQYFVKREGTGGTESRWDVYYRLDGKPVNAAANGGPPSLNPVSMVFSSAGRMMSGATVALAVDNPGGENAPADTLSLSVDYGGSTQFGGEFSSNFIQNGYPTGEYLGMEIAADGSIVANYSNWEKQVLGRLVLADFNNLQGLQPVGSNAWAETTASGQPMLGSPGQNGLAVIKGKAVEESNVDMSQELVNMIIAQRTYQANAQTIKTQDQVLQTLITMR